MNIRGLVPPGIHSSFEPSSVLEEGPKSMLIESLGTRLESAPLYSPPLTKIPVVSLNSNDIRGFRFLMKLSFEQGKGRRINDEFRVQSGFGLQCRQQPAAPGSARARLPADCHLEQTPL